jgi:hypothetical protein
LVFVEGVADAQDRHELVSERRLELPGDHLVGLAQVAAPFRVAHDHVPTADLGQIRG